MPLSDEILRNLIKLSSMALQEVYFSVFAELEKSWCGVLKNNREVFESKLNKIGHKIQLLESEATISLKGTLRAIIAAEDLLQNFVAIKTKKQEANKKSVVSVPLEDKIPRNSEPNNLNSYYDDTSSYENNENCIHIELLSNIEEESCFVEYCNISLQQDVSEQKSAPASSANDAVSFDITLQSSSSPVYCENSSNPIFPLEKISAVQQEENQESGESSSDTTTEIGDGFSCTLCTYKTYQKKVLRRHMKTHYNEDQNAYGELFSCAKCSYKTTRKVHYKRHILGVHDDSRPHLCDLCGKAFKRQDNLKQHKLLHATPEAYTTDPAPFQCNICDKICHSKAHLREHQAVHSTARSFLCEICGASFKTISVQRKHVNTIHRNPRSFACHVCKKRFNTNYALRRHMKQHPFETDAVDGDDNDTSISQHEKIPYSDEQSTECA